MTHNGERVFDTVIVVTDRRNLDGQLRDNILDFMQVGATVGAVTGRGSSKTQQLRQFLEAGKKIIICTLQTFPELSRQLDNAPPGRRYAESHNTAIRSKAEIMVDHFLEDVLPLREMKGEARAMVVTGGIERAVQYFGAFRTYLAERRSPYLPIVAFPGEHNARTWIHSR